MTDWLAFFIPWEFSLLVQISVWGSLWLYFRGLRHSRQKPHVGSFSAFIIGVLLIYLVTQTHFEYWAQYMFFVHRGQHLVLHHLAPFLIALSAPASVLAAGLPDGISAWLQQRRLLQQWWRSIYTFLQHPAVACLLFVGLIYFWLTPEIHFDAMLNQRLYWLMNWSMALDGLLFWWLMLEHGQRGITPRLGYGLRILLLAAIMPPQIILGARLAFSEQVWFDVYAVCGRAWPLDPLADQQLGGLLTWIPAAMMSVIAALVVLRFMLHAPARSMSHYATQ
jgi:putative membrane protein